MTHFTLIQPRIGMTKVNADDIRPAFDPIDGHALPHCVEVCVLETNRYYTAGERIVVMKREVFTKWRWRGDGTTL